MLIIGNFGLSYTQSKAQMGLWSEKRIFLFWSVSYPKRSFYQDRLGTNIGKVLNTETRFSQEHHGRSSPYGQ